MSVSATNTNQLLSVKNIAKIAILGAIAAILMMFDFPLPIAPSFYKFDFSEVAVLIGAFAMGPAAGAMIEGVKIILNFLFNGTITMGVGELANFLIGCALVVPASMMYQKNKTRKSALLGMLTGTLFMTAVGVALNYFVLIPAYVALAGFPMEAIIGMGAAINPQISNVLTLVLICVTPFNLLKGFVISAITFVLYKHVSVILHR